MAEFLFLLVGIAIGGFAAWFTASGRAENISRQKMKELESDFKQETAQRIRYETELSILKKSTNGGSDNFEAIAAKALKNSSEMFIKLANETMEKVSGKAESNFKGTQNAIEGIVKPLQTSLQKHEKLLAEMREGSSETFGSLKSYLTELAKSQKSLEKETGALASALKSPNVRGRWGEIGLRRIVEFSGMTEFCDFETQVSINKDNQNFRPDMIVKLPGGKNIAVDSKVPLNAYLDMIEAENENDKSKFASLHAKSVMRHVKELSSKAYWSQFDNSVDFVVLYMEVEPAFGAALAENKNLFAEAAANRIVFATPATLIALLQTVSYSWKQQTATENAQKIWKQSNEIYERLAAFSEYLHKIGGGIESLAKTYNQSIGSWERRVQPSIRKMEELGAASEKKKLKELELSETQIRK